MSQLIGANKNSRHNGRKPIFIWLDGRFFDNLTKRSGYALNGDKFYLIAFFYLCLDTFEYISRMFNFEENYNSNLGDDTFRRKRLFGVHQL